jgi:hypothetical protein
MPAALREAGPYTSRSKKQCRVETMSRKPWLPLRAIRSRGQRADEQFRVEQKGTDAPADRINSHSETLQKTKSWDPARRPVRRTSAGEVADIPEAKRIRI